MESLAHERSPDAPVYSNGQLMRVGAIYEFLARLLPTEGRDYSVQITFPDPKDPSSVSVKFDHFTKIGKVWCDYCTEMMKGSEIKK